MQYTVTDRDIEIINGLSPAERAKALDLIAEARRRKGQTHIESFFPDTGPLRRELYPKHIEFFAAGAIYRERCFMAANRVGKTEGAGGYETAMHLTGQYPSWWPGRRFTEPVRAWAAGKTNETTRDIIQRKLFGVITGEGTINKALSGTGLIRGSCIGHLTWKQGVQGLLDVAKIKHVSGGWSEIGLKSYQQGRGSFEGTEQDLIWLDEEPDIGIYGECVIRTATTNGLILMTFTPLEGMTETVLQFLPGGNPEHLAQDRREVAHA